MSFRGMFAFDLRGVRVSSVRKVLQSALSVCDFPLTRIRRRTGARVVVTVADTTGYATVTGRSDHKVVRVLHEPRPAGVSRAALGLFWLPTPDFPAGRIEVSDQIVGDPDLTREVFLSEAAHAVDVGTMTDAQRAAIFGIVHGGDSTAHGTHGWFDERGGGNYWADFVGELWMSLFLRSYAASLPRPLEGQQPWTHQVSDAMVPAVRKTLR